MNNEPWVRLIMFMMPNTSVSPAAIRNSWTPSCRPLSDCSINSAAPITSSGWPCFQGSVRGLHDTLPDIGVGLIRLDQFKLLHHRASLGVLDDLGEIRILDRMMVAVELEVAAHRLELHGLQ